jgi:hypothetical protein
MMQLHLAPSETLCLATRRLALKLARRAGKRYVEVFSSQGKSLAVLEAN